MELEFSTWIAVAQMKNENENSEAAIARQRKNGCLLLLLSNRMNDKHFNIIPRRKVAVHIPHS